MGRFIKNLIPKIESFGGPPPSIGWWPATIHGIRGPIRWWNGEHWSACAFKGESMEHVLKMAKTQADSTTAEFIKWSHPWWK